MQPTLTTFPQGGREIPTVVIGTKMGMTFVLDRLTGKPLTEVEERPAPAGTLRDEKYSPTQPVSVGMPQIGSLGLTEADMWGMTPFDQLLCRLNYRNLNTNGFYIPPSLERQLYLPGHYGASTGEDFRSTRPACQPSAARWRRRVICPGSNPSTSSPHG